MWSIDYFFYSGKERACMCVFLNRNTGNYLMLQQLICFKKGESHSLVVTLT